MLHKREGTFLPAVLRCGHSPSGEPYTFCLTSNVTQTVLLLIFKAVLFVKHPAVFSLLLIVSWLFPKIILWDQRRQNNTWAENYLHSCCCLILCTYHLARCCKHRSHFEYILHSMVLQAQETSYRQMHFESMLPTDRWHCTGMHVAFNLSGLMSSWLWSWLWQSVWPSLVALGTVWCKSEISAHLRSRGWCNTGNNDQVASKTLVIACQQISTSYSAVNVWGQSSNTLTTDLFFEICILHLVSSQMCICADNHQDRKLRRTFWQRSCKSLQTARS